MTSMLPHRRRAEELADAIDGRSPARHAEVRELLAVAASVQATPAVVPRADFTAELRAELVAAAHRELSPPNRGEHPRALRPRRSGFPRLGLAAATGAFVVVGGTTGIASASENALPGELLYPVKRGVEQIDLALTTDPAEQGRLELKLAETRLSEVTQLLASDDPMAETLVAQTLHDFTTSASDGSDLLLESQVAADQAEAAALVNKFAVDSSETLEVLSLALVDLPAPISAAEEFSAAAYKMAEIDAAASDACATCLEDEPSVSVTDVGGGEAPELLVTAPDGEVLVVETVPDPDTTTEALPPAGGSDDVHAEGPQIPGGTGESPRADEGVLETAPPTPIPDTSSSDAPTVAPPFTAPTPPTPPVPTPTVPVPIEPPTPVDPTAPPETDPVDPTPTEPAPTESDGETGDPSDDGDPEPVETTEGETGETDAPETTDDGSDGDSESGPISESDSDAAPETDADPDAGPDAEPAPEPEPDGVTPDDPDDSTTVDVP